MDIMPITLDTGETIELRACPLWLTLSNMQAEPTETLKVALAAQHWEKYFPSGQKLIVVVTLMIKAHREQQK